EKTLISWSSLLVSISFFKRKFTSVVCSRVRFCRQKSANDSTSKRMGAPRRIESRRLFLLSDLLNSESLDVFFSVPPITSPKTDYYLYIPHIVHSHPRSFLQGQYFACLFRPANQLKARGIPGRYHPLSQTVRYPPSGT